MQGGLGKDEQCRCCPKVKKERKRRGPVIKEGGKATAPSGGKDGRREKAKSLPPPPERATQRQWNNLTEEMERYRRKGLLSRKR